MVKINCNNCGKKLEAPGEAAGKKGKCPGCGEVFVIPEAVFSHEGSADSYIGQNAPGKQESAVDTPREINSEKTEVEKFSIEEAIRFGWNTMSGNLGFFIGLLITAGLIYIIPEILADALERAGLEVLHLSVRLIDFVLATIVGLGLYYKIPLNFCDGIRGRIADLFLQYRFFFRYIFATILYGLMCAGGVILLVVPGIYLAIRFSFYGYFIVDKNSGITESLKGSWRITRGSAWKLFLYSLVIGGMNILGALVLMVGLFATIPTSLAAGAFIYRKLLVCAQTKT